MAKKRKRLEKESKVSGKKRIKPVETVPEENSDAEDGLNASEDSHSQSSAEKPVKVLGPFPPMLIHTCTKKGNIKLHNPKLG